MPNSNMYSLNVKTWSPFVGCKFDCTYCKNSFQAQLKRWAKKNCQKCYNFEPHEHPERLAQSLPKTGYMQFIFTCSMGDISFCSTEYLERIVDRIRREPDKTFLIQSKNPLTFNRVKWPSNVILGTTIETDSLPQGISNAPLLLYRVLDLISIKHNLKMVTIEPIMDFALCNILQWIKGINPCMVWIGYNSRNNKLPEPSIEKVRELHWQLSKMGIVVMLKKLRVQEKV
ncbi:hypothetical protein LCGC14_0421220 [marine sediment metagenome]|uniref:DUF5131 family protein n=1 Tax=marine sediment metagenome TaxID=412755 RepID=A0A0F9SQT3_9ZZZZ